MLRMFILLAIAAALASAFRLYAVSYQTQQIADQNSRMTSEIAKLSQDITILRAERTYLMRPERIEPLAGKLGMRPVAGRQFMTPSELHTDQRQR